MTEQTYRGWFGRHARRRCPHRTLTGIYGDAINHVGGWRLYCNACRRYLDGPVSFAGVRMEARLEATDD